MLLIGTQDDEFLVQPIYIKRIIVGEKQMYYVYELIDPRNDNPFYIGKGCKGRMYYHVKRVKRNKRLDNEYLFRKINKILSLGLSIQYKKIHEHILDEEVAYDLETQRIAEIGIDNLCNNTYGGSGMRATPEIKKKLSISQNKRFKDPNERKKLSESMIKRFEDPNERKKLSESHKGKDPWNKGLKGSQVSWNKGLTKETDERVKKYSDTKMNHEVSSETRKQISNSKKGSIPWNKGKTGVQVAWNKGLTMEDERVRKNVENMAKTRYKDNR